MIGLLVLLLVLSAAVSAFAWYAIRKSFPQTDDRVPVASFRSDAEVIGDARGVPNMYAGNVSDLYTALG